MWILAHRIRVLWQQWTNSHGLPRKSDCVATLSRGESSDPSLDRLLLLFWAHYIEDGPHLLCTGSLWVVTFYRKQRRGCC